MLHLLVIHLHQLRQALAATWDDRRRGDTGALNTLELVILALGIVAIALTFSAAIREAVSSRLDQLR